MCDVAKMTNFYDQMGETLHEVTHEQEIPFFSRQLNENFARTIINWSKSPEAFSN